MPLRRKMSGLPFEIPETYGGPHCRKNQIFYELEKQLGRKFLLKVIQLPRKRPPKNAQKKGKFKTAYLNDFPGYTIDENGTVFGKLGRPLKFRWNYGQPFVRLNGGEKSVFWLFVGVGFQNDPHERPPKKGWLIATGPKQLRRTLSCTRMPPRTISKPSDSTRTAIS